MIQRTELLEHAGVSRDRIGSVEYAGAAAAGFLAVFGMWCGVGAEKKRSEPLATALRSASW